jgi:hypothetical protein
MTISVNADCSQITLTPADTSWITNITSGDADTCCTYLQIGTNCCDTTDLCIRTDLTGQLDYSITGCGSETIDSVSYNYYELTITGINLSCVQQLEYTDGSSATGTRIENNPTDLVVRIYYTGITTINFSVYLRTCTTNCIEYQIDGTIIITSLVDRCAPGNYSDSGPNVTIPDLPDGVTISGTDLLIDPDAFGMVDNFNAGIFWFSLVQNNIPDSNSVFVNCDVLCKVTDYIADDLCSNLYALYNALVYADSCETVTYEQKCSLWEFIGKELNYFETSPCGATSDCGCNS